MRALLLLVLLVGCGSVVSSELTSGDAREQDGKGGELGSGGRGGEAGGAVGGAGAGGELEAGVDVNQDVNQDAGGDLVEAGASCIDYVSGSVPGFGLNAGCNGEPPATVGACHARCELNGSHYVGCVLNNVYASYCYSSCSACP